MEARRTKRGKAHVPPEILAALMEALDEDLVASVVREPEADLSKLDEAGIETETKREAVRDNREARRIEKDEAMQRHEKRTVDKWQQIVLSSLLPFAALVATAVVIVGLIQRDTASVQMGLIALCSVCGGALYRLRPRGGDDAAAAGSQPAR